MKNYVLASLVLGWLGSACAATPIGPAVTSPSAQMPVAITPTQVTLVSELLPSTTYVDPNLSYAFDYPADWTISDLPDVPYSAVTIRSWNPDDLTGPRPQGEGLPEGGEKMDILPQAEYGQDFEQALPWFREGNSDRGFTEEAVNLPTGVGGILIRFEPVSGEPNVRCLLTAVNETTILLCGSGWDLKYFEPIAFSLRPAN